MNSFKFNVQTCMFSGKNCVKENAAFFKPYGSKAIIITSKFIEGYPNKALADVEDVFKDQEIEYLVLDDVKVDPPVEVVAAMAEKAREFNPDFLVGIGGGSSLDTCKGVGVLLDAPKGSDPYKVFYREVDPALNIKSQCRIPIMGIPTTAGTGAEVSPFAVMTRADIHTKLAIFPWVYCTVAFLDSRYIEGIPEFIIHTGAFDALAHGVESYIHVKNNPMNRMFAEFAFGLFKQFKDHMKTGELTEEDYENIMLHSFVQGLAFSSTDALTTIPHGMGYPLSHIKYVNHGLSCAIFLAEYVRNFKDQSIVQPIVEMCGFKDSDEFAAYCKSILEKDVDIEVSDDELNQWTDDFMKTGRTSSNPEPLDRDAIYNLYKKSLAPYIK